MKFTINLMSMEVVSFEFSIPRLGIFAPGVLPDSVEAAETWGELDE